MIETERLQLRSLRTTDFEALYALFSDPEVMKFSIGGTKTPDEVRTWLLEEIRNSKNGSGIGILAVKLRSSATVIGYCGLTRFSSLDGVKEIEIGYRLVRQYWGYGYATEAASAVRDFAFTTLQLDRLIALIELINVRSIAVAQKIGMSYEKEVLLIDYDHPDHLYSMRRTDLRLQEK